LLTGNVKKLLLVVMVDEHSSEGVKKKGDGEEE